MNKGALIVTAVAAAIAVVIGFAIVRKGSGVISVAELKSPSSYGGTITVTGVNGTVNPNDPTLFAIFDKKELQCQSPGCQKFLIPVKNPQGAPKVGDEVVLTGSFVNKGQGFFFQTRKMKVVKNHKIPGQ